MAIQVLAALKEVPGHNLKKECIRYFFSSYVCAVFKKIKKKGNSSIRLHDHQLLNLVIIRGHCPLQASPLNWIERTIQFGEALILHSL